MNLKESHWLKADYDKFIEELISMKDEESLPRAEKIIPTKYRMLGIKMNLLRSMANEIGRGDPESFLNIVGTEFYEAIIIQGYVIGNLKSDYEVFLKYCDEYLSKSDCWAICDMVIHFKLVQKYPEKFLEHIKQYLNSDNPWLQRSGLVFLLKFYVKTDYYSDCLKLSTNIHSESYYVKLAQAWLYSVAFPNHQDDIYSIISDADLKLTQLTVRKIKSLRHTTNNEKEILTSLMQKNK